MKNGERGKSGSEANPMAMYSEEVISKIFLNDYKETCGSREGIVENILFCKEVKRFKKIKGKKSPRGIGRAH